MIRGIDFATRYEPFPHVRSIGVLRGGGLGDVLFAAPALSALRATYPGARITLLGTALHKQLLAHRFPAVDELEVIDGIPGESRAEVPGAHGVAQRRRGEFDLGVQIHGGGRNSNAFLLRLQAPHTVGTRTPDAPALERNLEYVYYQHEILRALEVAALAGCRTTTLEPRISATPADRATAAVLLSALPRPLLAVHPGASDPRRRWPLDAFAQVAARFVREGGSAVVLGGPAETDDAEEIVALAAGASDPARLVSRTDLSMSELVGVLESADVFVGNDSGPRHLAQALGTPTASVFWFGNLINAGPFERGRHRVQLSWTTNCPVCGRDATQVGWTAQRCEHNVSFVADVPTTAVWQDIAGLMATTVRSRGR